MMLSIETLFQEMLRACPELESVQVEHITDLGELIPHMCMADVTRYVCNQLRSGRTASEFSALLEVLERAMVIGDGNVQNLVAVSFVENLSDEPDARRELRKLFGRSLLTELRALEPYDGME